MKDTFSSSFWSRFSRLNWEKKPLLVKKFHSPLIELNHTEIYSLLVSYADHCRKIENSAGFKFFVEGQQLHEQEVLQLLPKKSDESLRGYHERMHPLFFDYCLVCDELLQVNVEKFKQLKEFMDGLYHQVGFPNRFTEMGLYLGNYRRTPFGVHVDGCGVFSFPIIGRKKFRLWSKSFGEKNPQLDQTFQYAKYKKDSQVLTAEPGDMTYWPSSAWHIAESNGSFNATWSLGVWVDRIHRENISEALAGLIAKALGKDATLGTTVYKDLYRADGKVILPELYERSLKALQNISAVELQNVLQNFWLNHIAKQGFKNVPQKKSKPEPKLKLSARIQLRNSNSPILWSNFAKSTELCCNFEGTSIALVNSKNLLKLIQTLNTGETCLVSDFLSDQNKIRDLQSLNILNSAGALLGCK